MTILRIILLSIFNHWTPGSKNNESHEALEAKSHTFENEEETEERQGHENVTWFNCAGLLQYLKSQLLNVEEIIDEVESADNPNQEYFLNKVIETVGEVKDTASDLLKISSQALEKVEKEKMTLDDSNQKDLPTMPSLDPGMRSKHLTDKKYTCQKIYLIQIGPNQPILQVYPSNSNIAKGGHKQSRFNPSLFREYPHLEYS